MTYKERFHANVERKLVDRPASRLGIPAPEAIGGLLAQFEAASLDELKHKLNDDVYPVEVPYHHPPAKLIEQAHSFGLKVILPDIPPANICALFEVTIRGRQS